MKNKNNIFNFFKSSSLKKLKPFKYIEILKPFHINNPLVSMAYDHHKLYKSYSNDLDGLEFVFHELKYKKSLYEKLGIINSLNYKNIIDKFNSISIQKEWVDAISYMTENYPDYNFIDENYFIVVDTTQRAILKTKLSEYKQDLIIVNPKTNKFYRIFSGHVKIHNIK